jgi:hypothetical protein
MIFPQTRHTHRRPPGRPAQPEAERFGELLLSPPRPERSDRADHPTTLMIADAVGYMSARSWKQPDSHGRSGTSSGLKQQPASPEAPAHGLFPQLVAGVGFEPT